MHTGRPPHCIKARCSAFFQVPKNARTKAPVRSSRPQKPHTGFPTAHKRVLPGPQNAHRSPTLHKGPKLFSSSVWNGMPLEPQCIFLPGGCSSNRRHVLAEGLGFGWLRFALPRRICPRFWALERPAAACVFRGLQNAHQGSSAQGFGPLRGLQQHAFSGACKTHIREALPKPGKTGGNMSRNLFVQEQHVAALLP